MDRAAPEVAPTPNLPYPYPTPTPTPTPNQVAPEVAPCSSGIWRVKCSWLGVGVGVGAGAGVRVRGKRLG